MDKHILSVKYSIFGNYDYIDATPENVSKLYSEFAKDGFLPNMITLLKIKQPQNVLEQILRPQLINKQNNCVISILPERLDVDFAGGVLTDDHMRYFKTIIEMFDLKISRIALITSAAIDNLTEEDLLNFNTLLTAPANYEGEKDLIEYSSRRVSRKFLDSIGELINVGRNIIGITESVGDRLSVNKIQVDTDINTRGELTRERFDLENCEDFFKAAAGISDDVFNNILVM